MIPSTSRQPLPGARIPTWRARPSTGRVAWRYALRVGATTAVAAVLGYALLFTVYAAIRYSLSLWAAPPEVGLWSTWGMGLLSLFVAIVTATLILLIPALLVGVVTALIVANLAAWLHGAQHPQRMSALGVGVALAIVLGLHWPFFQLHLLGPRGLTSETYLFWIGLPSVIYLALVAWQIRRLQRNPVA